MTEKLCWFCKRMYLENAEAGYSEYTPGADMSMGCYRSHWELDTLNDNIPAFRKKIHMAENCQDFEPRDDAK